MCVQLHVHGYCVFDQIGSLFLYLQGELKPNGTLLLLLESTFLNRTLFHLAQAILACLCLPQNCLCLLVHIDVRGHHTIQDTYTGIMVLREYEGIPPYHSLSRHCVFWNALVMR